MFEFDNRMLLLFFLIIVLAGLPLKLHAGNMFETMCTDAAEVVSVNGPNSFKSELIVNKPSECAGNPLDFYALAAVQTVAAYSLNSELSMSFNVEGAESLLRGNFVEIFQEQQNGCEQELATIARMGKWDDNIFLATKGKNTTDFKSEKIEKIAKGISILDVQIAISQKDASSVKVTLFLNGSVKLEATSFVSTCHKTKVRFGVGARGKKYGEQYKAAVAYKAVNLNGEILASTVEKDGKSYAKLGFAHLLDNDPLALCNDGTVASFYSSHPLSEQHPQKVLVAFQGGGAALSLRSSQTKFAEAYDKRPKELMTSPLITFEKKEKNLGSYFNRALEAGWGLIFVPYCSSDLYAGDHELQLSNKVYQVRGRRIVNALFERLKNSGVINDSTDLLLVGGSAGDMAISANMNIIEKLPKERLRLLFTLWQVPAEREYVEKKQRAQFNKLMSSEGLKFVRGNPAEHCKESYTSCGPNWKNLSRYSYDDIFIEGHWRELPSSWAFFTPRHMKDKKLFQEQMRETINRAGGGLAFLSDKPWKPKKDFNHDMGKLEISVGNPTVIPSDIVWNWISGKGETRYIGD